MMTPMTLLPSCALDTQNVGALLEWSVFLLSGCSRIVSSCGTHQACRDPAHVSAPLPLPLPNSNSHELQRASIQLNRCLNCYLLSRLRYGRLSARCLDNVPGSAVVRALFTAPATTMTTSIPS
jgi:hypothetical protein